MRFARSVGYGVVGAAFGAALGGGVGAAAGLVAYAGVSVYMGRWDPDMLSISVALCTAVGGPLGILSGVAEGVRRGWRGEAGVRDLLRGVWARFAQAASRAGR